MEERVQFYHRNMSASYTAFLIRQQWVWYGFWVQGSASEASRGATDARAAVERRMAESFISFRAVLPVDLIVFLSRQANR